MKILILLLALMVPVMAEDWTVNGVTYHNVTVGTVEADKVHIMYDGGLGAVALADLTPDLQKRFGYDPNKAKAAANAEAARLAALDQQHALEVQQQAKASAAAIPTPTAAQSSAASSNSLSAAQRASIQAQIESLQQDITFMQGEEAKVYQESNKQVVKADGNVTTQGAYTQKIVDEQAEIQQLQAQLR